MSKQRIRRNIHFRMEKNPKQKSLTNFESVNNQTRVWK